MSAAVLCLCCFLLIISNGMASCDSTSDRSGKTKSSQSENRKKLSPLSLELPRVVSKRIDAVLFFIFCTNTCLSFEFLFQVLWANMSQRLKFSFPRSFTSPKDPLSSWNALRWESKSPPGAAAACFQRETLPCVLPPCCKSLVNLSYFLRYKAHSKIVIFFFYKKRLCALRSGLFSGCAY